MPFVASPFPDLVGDATQEPVSNNVGYLPQDSTTVVNSLVSSAIASTVTAANSFATSAANTAQSNAISTAATNAASASKAASTITGLATVAISGSYNDLSNKPILGSAAFQNTTAFDAVGAATAAQSAAIAAASTDATTKANNAVSTAEAFSIQRSNHTGTQSASTITGLATVATSGSYADLSNKPVTGVFSVAGRTGAVTLTHSDITDFNSSVTALAAVTSVNGQTGNVTIPTGVLSVTSGATTQTGAVTLGSMASLDEEDVYNYLANQYDPIGSAANAASASVPLNTKGAANGVASLDGGGKVPVAQLPSTLMRYIGTWNATTNTPTLSNGTGVSGNVYNVSVAGTSLGYTWNVGDWAIYNGSKWEQSPGSDEVVSVAGKTGIVTLDTSNISENSSYLYFTAARAIAAVTWSTLTGIPSWIASVTTFAQSLLTSASAAAARTVLGLGSISTFLGDQNLRVADQPSFCGGAVSFGSGGSASFADEGFIINNDGEITGNFSVDANGAATFSQGAINLNANGSANFANSNVVIAADGGISAKSLTLTTPLPATSVSGVVTTSTTAGQQINKIVTMGQAAYNALGTYSSTTLYVIVGS